MDQMDAEARPDGGATHGFAPPPVIAESAARRKRQQRRRMNPPAVRRWPLFRVRLVDLRTGESRWLIGKTVEKVQELPGPHFRSQP